MRVNILILLWLISCAGVCELYAIDVLEQAKVLYEQQRFQEALELLEKKENKNAAELMLLGHCFCAQEHYAQALLMWRRVQVCGCGRELTQAQEAIERLPGKSAQIDGDSLLARTWWTMHVVLSYIPFSIVQIIFLIMWYFFIILCAWTRSQFYRKIVWTSAFMIFLMAGIIMIRYKKYEKPLAIILEKTQLEAGPALHYHGIRALGEADEVLIVGHRQGWYKVQCCDGSAGWVAGDKIVVV